MQRKRRHHAARLRLGQTITLRARRHRRRGARVAQAPAFSCQLGMRSHLRRRTSGRHRDVFFEGFSLCSGWTTQVGQAALHNLATTDLEARGFGYASIYKDARSEGVYRERHKTFHYIQYRPSVEAPPGLEFYGVPPGCLAFLSLVTCDLISRSFFE